ncbi:FadR/GntR family transcriptional regulator [Sporomusa termitida]|uniref:HTH-type transcriptional regulator LutR n=1 Tax=Sporomusa termitida TaxID=2377 RepID=A0A517DZ58_9FIRM|nr:FadR/GntR family transcriptional regulator [Sporomusa termitida]QDR82645.1 HTH-type transcriptional regulator LutR [Sporomusa termitida]
MEITQRKKTRLYRDIVAQIRQLIQDGSLAPGDQLLPERQLAEKLGVSRSALREALTVLDSMGLIDITPGGGACIKKVGIESMVEPLAAIMLKEKESVFELLETRRILEIEIAKLAAVRASKSDLYQIREAAMEMNNDILNARDTGESDVNFHLSIARASQNTILYNIMQMISGLMREGYGPSRRELLRGPIEEQRYWSDHNFLILDAIQNRDPDRAAELIKEHIQKAEVELRCYFDEVDSGSNKQGSLEKE